MIPSEGLVCEKTGTEGLLVGKRGEDLAVANAETNEIQGTVGPSDATSDHT